MNAIEEIFQEYRRMRRNGLDAKEALRTLRGYVEPLTQAEREELARLLRAWEQGEQQGDKETASSVIRPLRKKADQQDLWTECSSCGSKNRATEVFCYSCGHLLQDPTHDATRTFADASNDLFRDEYFGPDSVLVLQMRDMPDARFEIRPQLRNHEIVIGRSTENQTMRPDIDLSSVQGAALGVSRLHLALIYHSDTSAIQIYDLGSSNGSFINGQRIHPSEQRVLRNGDELTLGKLVLRVLFRHPGEALK